MRPSSPIALVTGANRGIGFEVRRQLSESGMRVLLAARDPAKGEAAARALAREGLAVEAVSLDVPEAASIRALMTPPRLQKYSRGFSLGFNAAICASYSPRIASTSEAVKNTGANGALPASERNLARRDSALRASSRPMSDIGDMPAA